jgi:hypothetical protein
MYGISKRVQARAWEFFSGGASVANVGDRGAHHHPCNYSDDYSYYSYSSSSESGSESENEEEEVLEREIQDKLRSVAFEYMKGGSGGFDVQAKGEGFDRLVRIRSVDVWEEAGVLPRPAVDGGVCFKNVKTIEQLARTLEVVYSLESPVSRSALKKFIKWPGE